MTPGRRRGQDGHGLGQLDPFWGALKGEGAPAWPGAGGGGQCLPRSGNGKSFSSFAFRPQKAWGGSWLRARGALLTHGGSLETIPLSETPQAPLSSFTPFPLPCFIQARTPPAGTAVSVLTWPLARGCGTPGTAGLEGRSLVLGKEPCQEEELSHSGRSKLSLSASPLPHTSPRSPGSAAPSTYAHSAFGASLYFHQHPHPPLHLALGWPAALWDHSGCLQTQPVAPRAPCGAGAPVTPPCLSRGHIRGPACG